MGVGIRQTESAPNSHLLSSNSRILIVMAFDPNLPADHSPLSSAEMRVQLQGLKALIDIQQIQMVSLQQQLSPLMPVLSRTAGGQWTLAYAGPAQSIWQIWARYAGSEAWSDFGEIS